MASFSCSCATCSTITVALSSVSNELRAATRVPLQQLKTDHETAAALCCKLGHRNCKALREAKMVDWYKKGLTADELKLLGTRWDRCCRRSRSCTSASQQPAPTAGGGRQLVEGLGAGALPAVWPSCVSSICKWATQTPRRSPPPCGARRPAAAQDPLSGPRRHRRCRAGGPRAGLATESTVHDTGNDMRRISRRPQNQTRTREGEPRPANRHDQSRRYIDRPHHRT